MSEEQPPKSSWVPTEGTTLGALVGLGVAAVVSVLDSFDIHLGSVQASAITTFVVALLTYLHVDGRK